MKEPVLQATPPRLGRSSEASRSWTGTASSTPDAVARSLQDDDDRMANPQNGNLASSLPLADLPYQELAKRPFRIPQALCEVLRERHGELQRRARMRPLHLVERRARQLQQSHVVRGPGAHDVLAVDE